MRNPFESFCHKNLLTREVKISQGTIPTCIVIHETAQSHGKRNSSSHRVLMHNSGNEYTMIWPVAEFPALQDNILPAKTRQKHQSLTPEALRATARCNGHTVNQVWWQNRREMEKGIRKQTSIICSTQLF